jgi:hypothetical protein
MLKSKTVWLNLIVGFLAIIAFINPELLAACGVPADKQQSVLTIVGAITAIANIIMRVLKGQPPVQP